MKLIFTIVFVSIFTLLSAQDYCNMNRFDEFVFDESEIEIITNIKYGEGLNNLGNMQDLKLDIYRPKPALDELTKKPAVFFVHGGGLVGGSKDSQGAIDLGYLYAQLGYVYISIDYRIGWNNGEDEDGCGGDTTDLFRATYRAVQDVKAAYRFIKGEAAAYGIDTNAIFVEGNSTDDTWQKIQEIQKKYTHSHDIKITQQKGKGKADAVREGYKIASGDILMILDADLTVPPEDLPKFYNAIASGKGDFVNGTRLVYPMDKEAMRFLNYLGNHFFSWAFTWLLEQRFKDTLCGTKVMFRTDYIKLTKNRAYFGDFDPFGDFDLLFGAHKLNLRIVEVPIRYRERTYGSTNISRFKHGVILLRMCAFASRKCKFI